MRAKDWHSLRRIKIRQTWNKYNLYNLNRFRNPIHKSQTYFKQKWLAKSMSRAYHGETMLEKPWTRLFRPKIRAVVPMKPRRLAHGDGSGEAAGRGSGTRQRPDNPKMVIPYMSNVYAQLERRLDTAIFRAMFASSSRQARQFVIHGFVKVNGKKMIYPAYKLNPGDMFQVEPERVMFATGKKKISAEEAGLLSEDKTSTEAEDGAAKTEEAQTQEADQAETEEGSAPEVQEPKVTLKQLITSARTSLDVAEKPSARRKQEFREFQRLVRRALGRKEEDAVVIGNLENQLTELTSKLNIAGSKEDSAEAEAPSMTAEERKELESALKAVQKNAIDPSKPYATPWEPRDYMSAFAFIPRYLEVHHKICSAVYIRHPVVRPGRAEVPSPFNGEVLGLAYNWYLRRR